MKNHRMGMAAGAVFGLVLLATALYPQLTVALGLHATPDVSTAFNWLSANTHGLAAAGATMMVPPGKLAELLTKLKAAAKEFEGKVMPPDKATEFETMAQEAKGLQDQFDREVQVRAMEQKAVAVPDPLMPADTQPGGDTKDQKGRIPRPIVAGYMKLGDFVVASKGYRDFRSAGSPRGQVRLAQVKDLFEPLVALSVEAVEEMKAAQVPTIGTGVIEPTLVPEIVRVTEHDRLTLRDILNVSQTSSDAVKYTRITQYVRGAQAVARSAAKPDSAIVFDSVTEAVRTIAVWMPVEDQQLDDMPALAGLINGELLYDVAKHLEELVAYGSGVGEEFEGVLINPLVKSCRKETGDTLIDIARRGVTDVRRAGYEPNGILADPLDWESIVLTKGTDKKYIWVVVTEGATQRLWAVPVIESVGMQDFQGFATEERNLLVGDFARGATLWDRMQAGVSVGYINDQFIKNQRTLLAELRAAFGVTRPGAFRKYQTQAPSAS